MLVPRGAAGRRARGGGRGARRGAPVLDPLVDCGMRRRRRRPPVTAGEDPDAARAARFFSRARGPTPMPRRVAACVTGLERSYADKRTTLRAPCCNPTRC